MGKESSPGCATVWSGARRIQAFQILIKLQPDLPRAFVLFVNDCQPALAALRKGSYHSPQLQADSIAIHQAAIQVGCFPLFLHVSGKHLIETGIDDGSRSKARLLQGPACNSILTAVIHTLAASIGKMISVDFFASSCNALVPRFMSWTIEPNSELTDAFSARSWDYSVCSSCNQTHREFGFYFPPKRLAQKVVQRALSDKATGIFLISTSQISGAWMTLRRYQLAPCVPVDGNTSFSFVTFPQGPHSLFAFDFGGTDYHLPPCCQAFQAHSPGRLVTEVEVRVRAELQRQLRDFGFAHASSTAISGCRVQK